MRLLLLVFVSFSSLASGTEDLERFIGNRHIEIIKGVVKPRRNAAEYDLDKNDSGGGVVWKKDRTYAVESKSGGSEIVEIHRKVGEFQVTLADVTRLVPDGSQGLVPLVSRCRFTPEKDQAKGRGIQAGRCLTVDPAVCTAVNKMVYPRENLAPEIQKLARQETLERVNNCQDFLETLMHQVAKPLDVGRSSARAAEHQRATASASGLFVQRLNQGVGGLNLRPVEGKSREVEDAQSLLQDFTEAVELCRRMQSFGQGAKPEAKPQRPPVNPPNQKLIRSEDTT